MTRRRFLLALCVGLAGCAGLGALTQPPEVTLSDMSVRDIGLFEQRFGLTLRVVNPNDANLDIRGLTYTLDLNGRPFARGTSDQSVTVPRFGEATLDVPATTNMSGLLRQLDEWRKRGAKEALTYRLSGTIYPSYGSGIPFEHKGDVNIPFLSPRQD